MFLDRGDLEDARHIHGELLIARGQSATHLDPAPAACGQRAQPIARSAELRGRSCPGGPSARCVQGLPPDPMCSKPAWVLGAEAAAAALRRRDRVACPGGFSSALAAALCARSPYVGAVRALELPFQPHETIEFAL